MWEEERGAPGRSGREEGRRGPEVGEVQALGSGSFLGDARGQPSPQGPAVRTGPRPGRGQRGSPWAPAVLGPQYMASRATESSLWGSAISGSGWVGRSPAHIVQVWTGPGVSSSSPAGGQARPMSGSSALLNHCSRTLPPVGLQRCQLGAAPSLS